MFYRMLFGWLSIVFLSAGCAWQATPKYRVAELPSPASAVRMGDMIKWPRLSDRRMLERGGTVLFLPDCLSCSLSTVSFDGWGKTVRQRRIFVASPTRSSVLIEVLEARLDYELIRVGTEAPRVNGITLNRLLLVDFDASQIVTRVESDPGAIARRMQ